MTLLFIPVAVAVFVLHGTPATNAAPMPVWTQMVSTSPDYKRTRTTMKRLISANGAGPTVSIHSLHEGKTPTGQRYMGFYENRANPGSVCMIEVGAGRTAGDANYKIKRQFCGPRKSVIGSNVPVNG